MKQLERIKQLRKKYNLTQKDLALRAGVSQSLITKIESGKLDPTFTKAQLIFEALEQLRKKEELKAKDLMNKKVVFAEINDSVKETIQVMRKKGISQMPVLCNGNVCGIIGEGIILNKIASNPEKINLLKVGDLVSECPPIVSLNMKQSNLLHLLRDYPLILVSEKGDVKGVISKTDLLGKLE